MTRPIHRPKPYAGVSLANTLIRSREPGVRPRSFTAEVASILFIIGLLVGFGVGVVW